MRSHRTEGFGRNSHKSKYDVTLYQWHQWWWFLCRCTLVSGIKCSTQLPIKCSIWLLCITCTYCRIDACLHDRCLYLRLLRFSGSICLRYKTRRNLTRSILHLREKLANERADSKRLMTIEDDPVHSTIAIVRPGCDAAQALGFNDSPSPKLCSACVTVPSCEHCAAL